MRDLPLLCIRVSQEDTRGGGLEGGQRVRFVDMFGEKVRLGEGDCRDLGIVRVVGRAAEACGFEDWAVCVEEALVVAQVVWVDVEVVAHVGEAVGAFRIADGVAIDCDGYGCFGGEDVGDF